MINKLKPLITSVPLHGGLAFDDKPDFDEAFSGGSFKIRF